MLQYTAKPSESDLQYLKDVGTNPLVGKVYVRLFQASAWGLGFVRLITYQDSSGSWLEIDIAHLICAAVQVVVILVNVWAAFGLWTNKWPAEHHESVKYFGWRVGVIGHTLCSVLLIDELPLIGSSALIVYAILAVIDQFRVSLLLRSSNVLLLFSFASQVFACLCKASTSTSITTLTLVRDEVLFWLCCLVVPTVCAFSIESHRRHALGQDMQHVMTKAAVEMEFVTMAIILFHVFAGCISIMSMTGEPAFPPNAMPFISGTAS